MAVTVNGKVAGPLGNIVTAETDPVTGGIRKIDALESMGFFQCRSLQPLYFNRFYQERPNCGTFAGIASYDRGNIQLSVTTVSGSNQVTYVSGDPIADAGTGAWMGVLCQNGRYSTVNVASRSGNVFTVSEPLTVTGPAVLSSYHETANGFHLSPFGGRALADMLFYADPAYLIGDADALYDVDSRATWFTTPWVAPYCSPQYWKQYGGMANNGLTYNYIPNPFNASNFFFSDSVSAVTASALGVGQGMSLDIPISAPGVLQFTCGHGLLSAADTNQFQAIVKVDGVQVWSAQQGPAIKQYRVPFPKGAVVTLILASLESTKTVISAGRVSVLKPFESARPAISQGDRVMVIGDSWTAEATRPEFVGQLRTRAEEIGATVLPSYGIGGTKASDAITAVGGVRNIDAWIANAAGASKCVIHYYINDNNASVAAGVWAANMNEIIRTLIAAQIVPVVILPGVTGTQSGAKALISTYGRVMGEPICNTDSITETLLSELQDKGSWVNTVRKRAGRTVYIASVPATYVARSSANTSIWDCVTAGATPATVTPA